MIGKDGSLRDDIAAAMAEVAAKDVGDAADDDRDVDEEIAGGVREALTGGDDDGGRGEKDSSGVRDGEGEGEDNSADAANSDAPSEGGDLDADQGGSAGAASVEPPEHWSTDDKARFAALPDDTTRRTVLDWRKQIERGANEKFEAAARERREIEQLMEPVAQELRLAGLTPIDGVRRLVGAETLLRQDPARGLEWLAQNYGRQVAGTGQAHEIVRRVATALGVEVAGNGKAEPETAEARRLAALEARIAEQERERQQAYIQQQTHAVRSAEDAIRDFAEAKDERGHHKHPHFEQVKVQMGALMQSGVAKDLADAYERAVWADPEIRAAMTKAQQEQAAREADAARRASVAKAKVATTPRTASAKTATAEDDEANLSRRELIAREFAKRSEASRARI